MVVKTETLEQLAGRHARELHEAMMRQGIELDFVAIQMVSNWKTSTAPSAILVAASVPRGELAELFGHLTLKYLAPESDTPLVESEPDITLLGGPRAQD